MRVAIASQKRRIEDARWVTRDTCVCGGVVHLDEVSHYTDSGIHDQEVRTAWSVTAVTSISTFYQMSLILKSG
jgi:hypothetical protein